MSVYRIFSEKKPEFAVESGIILSELKKDLLISSAKNVRIINLYDVEELNEDDFTKAVPIVFSTPSADNIYKELPALKEDEKLLAIEYLPGQFDQRADSAAQCIAVLCGIEKPIVKYIKIYLIKGKIDESDFTKIKDWLINSMDSREADISIKTTLKTQIEAPQDVKVLDGFIGFSNDDLKAFLKDFSLAMDLDDIAFCRDYFKSENRNPTVTEIRMIDTYWSDHCRHTTFLTHIDDVLIEADYIQKSYDKFLKNKISLRRADKLVSLMEIATNGMRKLKADGFLQDLDESEEINACSFKIDVEGQAEKYLLMFKNETHNHPTEIEPFGGGATCLGGAIRDVLSGRAYTHQAMRITGCSDPRIPVADTIPGKLPPRKITNVAATGYASYGNQIGLAGGLCQEIYHDGYVAKRMELGALAGAAPASNVIRKRPEEGDAVILLGGKTGRDGCGGATGSSKSHNSDSLDKHVKSSAEVPKGDPPEERKILRLFRNPEVARLIKRCNDFGAGGVSVAIGELADGLFIDLDKIPRKYEGLDGTELAISESQERMAVVVAGNDAEKFIELASGENIEAVVVAEVKAEPRLKMSWRGKLIVDLSREFLNSNGTPKHAKVKITKPTFTFNNMQNTVENWKKLITDLNICSQRSLGSRFDSTAGAGTVLMPLSGKTQQTPTQAMAAIIPVASGETKTASVMAWGFNPFISQQSPYHGAAFAVVESISKVVAAGSKSKGIRLSFQEYFERLKDCPERWGKPFAALLGALEAQLSLEAPSIGGKDSMSGTFEDIDVPPTLVSFAITTENSDNIISPEFKAAGNKIILIEPKYDENNLPDYTSLKQVFTVVEHEIERKNALSVWTLAGSGIAEGIFKMSLGNQIGAELTNIDDLKLFAPLYGAFIIEAKEDIKNAKTIGKTIHDYNIICGDVNLDMKAHETLWEEVLEDIFPSKAAAEQKPEIITFKGEHSKVCAPAFKTQKPVVLIPVFPGTNGEYDMQKAFEKSGAETKFFIMKNRSASGIKASYEEFVKLISCSNILAIPGGMSAGGEPEGSAKFIAAFIKNAQVTSAIHELLNKRDGLILGIGDGFHALMKTRLLPCGEIGDLEPHLPSLNLNKIGRYQSQIVFTRISAVSSPWLSACKTGDVYAAPFSSAEGRFTANEYAMQKLLARGQIAAQYADLNNEPSMDIRFNPADSQCAIESITSEDGRILGKMAHSERISNSLIKNVPGNKELPIFKAGVDYFK